MSKALKNKVKLNNVVDVVADYGATGNGTTDDTAAIQAALNYLSTLPAMTGAQGTLYFPAGSYLFSSTLKIPSNVRIRGNGLNFSTQLVPAASFTGSQAFTIDGTQATGGYMYRISIEDLTINAPSFPSGRTLFLIQDAYTLKFKNIFVYSSQSTIFNVTTSAGQVNDVLFDSCSLYGNGSTPNGIQISGAGSINQIRIIDCDIENCSNGIYTAGTAIVYVSGLYSERVIQGIDNRIVNPGCLTLVGNEINAGPNVALSLGFGGSGGDNTTIVGGSYYGIAGGLYLGAVTTKPKNLQILGAYFSTTVDTKNWYTNKLILDQTGWNTTKLKNVKTLTSGAATSVFTVHVQNTSGYGGSVDVDLQAQLVGYSVWTGKYRIGFTHPGSVGPTLTTVTEYGKANVNASAGNYTLTIAVTTANVTLTSFDIQVTLTNGGAIGSGITTGVVRMEAVMNQTDDAGGNYIQAL